MLSPGAPRRSYIRRPMRFPPRRSPSACRRPLPRRARAGLPTPSSCASPPIRRSEQPVTVDGVRRQQRHGRRRDRAVASHPRQGLRSDRAAARSSRASTPSCSAGSAHCRSRPRGLHPPVHVHADGGGRASDLRVSEDAFDPPRCRSATATRIAPRRGLPTDDVAALGLAGPLNVSEPATVDDHRSPSAGRARRLSVFHGTRGRPRLRRHLPRTVRAAPDADRRSAAFNAARRLPVLRCESSSDAVRAARQRRRRATGSAAYLEETIDSTPIARCADGDRRGSPRSRASTIRRWIPFGDPATAPGVELIGPAARRLAVRPPAACSAGTRPRATADRLVAAGRRAARSSPSIHEAATFGPRTTAAQDGPRLHPDDDATARGRPLDLRRSSTLRVRSASAASSVDGGVAEVPLPIGRASARPLPAGHRRAQQ